MEDKFAKELENMDLIKSADVNLNIPEDDGTLVTRNQESYASVKLELNGEMSEDQAASLARYIATEIGNSSTDNITIIDSNSNLFLRVEKRVQQSELPAHSSVIRRRKKHR